MDSLYTQVHQLYMSQGWQRCRCWWRRVGSGVCAVRCVEVLRVCAHAAHASRAPARLLTRVVVIVTNASNTKCGAQCQKWLRPCSEMHGSVPCHMDHARLPRCKGRRQGPQGNEQNVRLIHCHSERGTTSIDQAGGNVSVPFSICHWW